MGTPVVCLPLVVMKNNAQSVVFRDIMGDIWKLSSVVVLQI